MNGIFTLYVDQYGNRFTSRTVKELRNKIPGRISKMYQDRNDGQTVQTGYVIGQHWLTAFRPFEIPA